MSDSDRKTRLSRRDVVKAASGAGAVALAATTAAAAQPVPRKWDYEADVVIVGSYVGQSWDAVSASAPEAFTGFVQTLVSRGRRPIVVAFGNPYLLQQLPWIGTYLVAWGGFPVSQAAAARALTGVAAITGRLPISIPPYAVIGVGEERPAR